MKKLNLKVLVIVLLIVPLSYKYYNNVKYFVINYSINKIDIDTLSKYYQNFKIQNLKGDYTKIDFLNYLGDKNIKLKKQLKNKKIGLNSELKSSELLVFEGFYHFGLDNVDNEARWVINSIKFADSLTGDILIPLKNYYNLKVNNIYILDNDTVLKLNNFNTHIILGNSIQCDKEKIKMKLDTIDYSLSAFKFINQKLFFNHYIEDKHTLNVLLNDSILKNIVVKHPYVYVPFTYKPLSYFYCDE